MSRGSTVDSGIKFVDSTGLKPAPCGLKVRCSVTRAPSQQTSFEFGVPSFESARESTRNSKLVTRNLMFGCGGRIRTFGGRINNAVPYQLGYATGTRMKAEG